jgi:hypothetical protein
LSERTDEVIGVDVEHRLAHGSSLSRASILRNISN